MRLVNHPTLCNYYVTFRCNAKCSFCDIWEKPSPYIKLDEVEQNLKDLKKLGVKVIDFTGGEPLLHRELPQMLEMAKKMGFITTVTTNGLLYPKYAQSLKGNIDMLHFSLDSANEAIHNEKRGVDCFAFVMQSIEIALELGERPDIIFTCFEDNLDEIAPIYEGITSPNGLMLILNPVFNYNNIDEETLSPEQLKYISSWGRKKGVYLNDAFIKLRQAGGNRTEDPVCKAGSTTLVISPENQLVMPCYHLGIENLPISNNLFELYNSEKVQTLIQLEGKYKECEGCTINCYMQPSFASHLSKYWFYALPSTMKYVINKGTWKELFT